MRGPENFSAALHTRPAARGSFCRLHVVAAADAQGAQLGCIVAKKLLRTSVRRNEAKRQIRESFRLVAPQLAARHYLVRVIGVNLAISEKAWGQQLRGELDRLWRATITGRRSSAPQQ